MDITKLSREEFREIIIAQNDSGGYDPNGYVVGFNGKQAAIARFGHCSCYGTYTSLGGDRGTINWEWIGSLKELLKLARYKLDPHYTLGSRKADPKDSDYCHLLACYKQVLEWNRKRS